MSEWLTNRDEVKKEQLKMGREMNQAAVEWKLG